MKKSHFKILKRIDWNIHQCGCNVAERQAFRELREVVYPLLTQNDSKAVAEMIEVFAEGLTQFWKARTISWLELLEDKG